jgi:hypothetical protein
MAGSGICQGAILSAETNPSQALRFLGAGRSGVCRTRATGRPVTAFGLERAYEIHGSGKPLVLLHGGFGSVGSFGPTIAALAAGALEHACHGCLQNRNDRDAEAQAKKNFEQMTHRYTALALSHRCPPVAGHVARNHAGQFHASPVKRPSQD